jgi:hypothetical protein
MSPSNIRRDSFIETFVDAVTVRPFLDDLARVRRAANLRVSSDVVRAFLEEERKDLQAA